jgi:hypothetical protein
MVQQLQTEQIEHRHASAPAPSFTSLAQERRSHVDTACAAYHLGRRPQTMRVWACLETGPIRPKRVNGRLAWPVSSIRLLLSDGQ